MSANANAIAGLTSTVISVVCVGGLPAHLGPHNVVMLVRGPAHVCVDVSQTLLPSEATLISNAKSSPSPLCRLFPKLAPQSSAPLSEHGFEGVGFEGICTATTSGESRV